MLGGHLSELRLAGCMLFEVRDGRELAMIGACFKSGLCEPSLGFPLHLLSGHCTYVGTFGKIVPIRPDNGLLFEMSRHGQVVVVGTIYINVYGSTAM